MPRYDWFCKNCLTTVDKICKHTDEFICDDCGEKLERQFPTGTNFALRGIGWHKTDYVNRETQRNGKRFGKKIEIKSGRGY